MNFTALPFGAESGAAVNEAPPATGVGVGVGVATEGVGVGVGVAPLFANAIQSRFWPSPEKVSFTAW